MPGMRIDRVVTRNGDNPAAIGHYYMLSLPDHAEACLFQCLDRALMRDARDFTHASGRHVHFANFHRGRQFPGNLQVFTDDSVADVSKRFFLRDTLRPTARKTGTTHAML